LGFGYLDYYCSSDQFEPSTLTFDPPLLQDALSSSHFTQEVRRYSLINLASYVDVLDSLMPTTTLLMREIPLWDAFCKKLKSHTEVRKVCSESWPKYVSPQKFNSCVLPCSSAVPGCVMGVSCVLLWQPHAVQGGVSFKCRSTKACHSSTAKLYMSQEYHTCGCSDLRSN